MYDNGFFKADKINDVVTEYDTLQKKYVEVESMLEEEDKNFLNHERQEFARVKKQHGYKKTPREGYTFMQFKQSNPISEVESYKESIWYFCNTDELQPFENFFDTLDKIDENAADNKSKMKFVPRQSSLLLSGTLVQLIPQKCKENKTAQIAIEIEISNFTPEFLTVGIFLSQLDTPMV